MKNSNKNIPRNAAIGFPAGITGPRMASDPPLPGARELGEKLVTTLMERAKRTALVKEKDAKSRKEVFDTRNIANQEWQQLDKQGREERQASDLETKRVLSQIALQTQSNVKQQETNKQIYLEEVKRRRAEQAEESIRIDDHLKEELTHALERLQKGRLHYAFVASKTVSNFKETKMNEVKSANQEAKHAIARMEENHRKRIDEMKKEGMRKNDVSKQNVGVDENRLRASADNECEKPENVNADWETQETQSLQVQEQGRPQTCDLQPKENIERILMSTGTSLKKQEEEFNKLNQQPNRQEVEENTHEQGQQIRGNFEAESFKESIQRKEENHEQNLEKLRKETQIQLEEERIQQKRIRKGKMHNFLRRMHFMTTRKPKENNFRK